MKKKITEALKKILKMLKIDDELSENNKNIKEIMEMQRINFSF